MSFLNFNSSFIIHEDQNDHNPLVRTPDISQSIQHVTVDREKSDKITIHPSETKDIAVTSRSLLWDSTTELHFERHSAGNDAMRIKWTGTGLNPVFRTKRAIGGGSSTVVDITRITPYVARITQSAGTAWMLGSVATGDLIRFEKTTDSFSSPFSVTNQGKTYLVQAKGANYIDFIDNGEISLDSGVTLGASYSFALIVMTQGPVRIGDTISVSGSGINPSNTGKFEVVDISSEYLEVVNPFGYDETVLYGSNSLTVYEFLIGFLHLRADSRFKIKFDNQSEWLTLDRIGEKAIFIGSACAYRIQATNDGPMDVEVSLQYARVLV
jgi:hypothetical protein